MRLLKILIYLLFVLVLQGVVFARINFFGVVPDLVLVSVIIYAILEERQRAIIFSAGSGFLQDILSFGIYINTVIKIVVCLMVSNIKQSFLGNDYFFAAGMVAVFTPLSLMAEALIYSMFAGMQIDPLNLILNLVLGTIYNLILVPVLLPILRKVAHD